MTGYLPTDACVRCKGECCKLIGCNWAPNDFDVPLEESLVRKIEDGLCSIVYHGDNKYSVKSRHVNNKKARFDSFGVCALLGDNGCSLAFNDRPKGARLLKPRDDSVEDSTCESDYTFKMFLSEWEIHVDILERLYNKYEGEE
jgi:hypothetical protein